MSKVVIIDDNTLIAKLYETNLIAQGHTVKVASDGVAGFQMVKEFNPDILLIDLMIPEMPGVEVIKELRKDIEFASLPILAYSGGDEDLLSAARQSGASSTISKKDSSLQEILKHLNELLPGQKTSNSVDHENASNLNEFQAQNSSSSNRVLIVEDDLLIVMIVRGIVENAGYESIVVGDGREAYRLLTKDADFAAGIFDVHLPYLTGHDLLRHMRTEKRLMKIPVMIMTTEETVRIQLESFSAGAAVFLQKPFERKTFEALFKTLISN